MATPKAETKPGPDLGSYPMMHPYPGFRACKDCGALLTWDAQARRWVTAIFGKEHRCDERSARRPR
jgi:hypothetical protein